MEVTRGLLVALMFVTILTLGIANILAALASAVARQAQFRVDRILVSWALFVLFTQLVLFWQIGELMKVETWSFVSFTYVIAGPAVLFFATQVLIAEAPADDAHPAPAPLISARFFWLLATVEGWLALSGVVLGEGLATAAAANVALLALAVAMATMRNPRAHAVGTGIGWLVFTATILVHGFRG